MCDFASEIKSNPGSNLAPIGTIMSAIGSMVSAGTAQRVGNAQQTSQYFTAGQQLQGASNLIAAGQRTAADEQLKTNLLISRAMAVAGANGGDATSPGVAHLVADLAGRGAYNAGVALYNAEDAARFSQLGAEADMYEGGIQKNAGLDRSAAYLLNAGSNLAKASSLFSKYGQGGPNGNPLDSAYDLRVG
ncbi:MAG: hypothetical protein KGL35_07675, partial [Bradyrhizobium sp.]|nr:hypothetical protein [Bradyrhizobium sp.]